MNTKKLINLGLVVILIFLVTSCKHDKLKLSKEYTQYTDKCVPNNIPLLQKNAASNNIAESALTLAFCYYSGKGVDENLITAKSLFQKAAEMNNPTAQLFLAGFYMKGYGTSKDMKQGDYWLKRSAENGNIAAQLLLGDLYFIGGYGDKRDLHAAMKWHEKAARQGDAAGQLSLGIEYMTIGHNKIADQWFRKAAQQGNNSAKIFLKMADFTDDPLIKIYVTILLSKESKTRTRSLKTIGKLMTQEQLSKAKEFAKHLLHY